MFKKALIVGAVCLASTAQAKTVTYDCNIKSQEGRGFVGDRVIFSVDTAQKRAGVVDGIVMYVHKKPISADFEQLSNGKYRLKWTVKNIRNGGTDYTASYSARLDPASRKVSVSARVRGYDNSPYGAGRCNVVPGESILN